MGTKSALWLYQIIVEYSESTEILLRAGAIPISEAKVEPAFLKQKRWDGGGEVADRLDLKWRGRPVSLANRASRRLVEIV